MSRLIVSRFISALPVLFVVALLSFVAVRILPGDLAVLRLGDSASLQDVEALRTALGLDKPIAGQFADWFVGVVRGDFGVSLANGEPVGDRLIARLPVTLELALLSMIVSLVIAIPLGVISASRSGSRVDYAARIFAVAGQAVPGFWMGIMLILFVSTRFGWVPPLEYRNPLVDPVGNLQQFALPSLVLGTTLSASVMRLTRSMMLEVLGSDYIRTARAKGLSTALIMRRHALRNAALPIVTMIGVQVSVLIGGSIVIEQVFSLPGVGRQTLNAVVSRDYSQLQLNVLFLAAVVVAVNTLTDISYVVLDPRIRNK